MSRQVWGTGGKDRHRLTITLSQTRRVNVSQLESKKKTYTYALTQHFGCSSLLTAITPKCLHRRLAENVSLINKEHIVYKTHVCTRTHTHTHSQTHAQMADVCSH